MPRLGGFLRNCRQALVLLLSSAVRDFSGENRKPDLAGKSGLIESYKLHILNNLDLLAESGGFEPPVELLVLQRFSKPPPSATRPTLQPSPQLHSECRDEP